jgi:hypothetical protein
MRDIRSQQKLYSLLDKNDPFGVTKINKHIIQRQLMSAKPSLNKRLSRPDTRTITKNGDQQASTRLQST